MKSRDLANAKTYQNGTRLFNTTKKDIDKLSDFDGDTWAGKVIDAGSTKERVLEVLVPNTKLTGSQITNLNRTIDYANQNGVRLDILVGGN